ncbi:MAG: DUF302 domain-containing protein [Spirochaetota bacterium]
MNVVAIVTLLLLLFSCQSFEKKDSSAKASMQVVESAYDSKTTLDRLEKAIAKKGLRVFLRLDHQKGAKSSKLDLPPTELLLFGSPKVGTLLMQCKRQIGIDLPLKFLVWEEKGKTYLGYTAMDFLQNKHQVAGCKKVFAKVKGVLSSLATSAAR